MPALPSTGILRGVVLDPAGEPLADASVQGAFSGESDHSIDEVKLIRRSMRGELEAPVEAAPHRDSGAFSTRSRADGSFEVSGLPLRDSYDVAAWSPGLGVVVVAGVPVRAEEPANVTLRFPRGVVLHGTITNEVGVPLNAARVQIMGTQDGHSYSSFLSFEADEDGSWETPPLARQAFSLMASAHGFKSEHRQVTWDPQRERDVRADFQLAPAPVVRGRLVAPDGTTARFNHNLTQRGIHADSPQVALFGSYEDPAAETNFRDVGHDEGTIDGHQDRWELVTDGTPARYVSVWYGNTLLGVAQPRAGAEADIVVHFDRLRPRVKRDVAVRVIDEERAAIPDLHGELHADSATSDRVRELGPESVGLLRIDAVEAGTYELRIQANQHVTRRVPLVVDDVPGPLEVEVKLARAEHFIPVVVRTTGGEPAGGARLFVLDAEGHPVDTPEPITANLEGRAKIYGLAAHEYTILATRKDLAPAARRVRLGGEVGELELVCAQGVDVQIDTPGSSGPFSVRVEDEAGITVHEDRCTDVRRFGSGVNLRLAPGRHTVTVRCPGFEPGRAEVDVAPGAKVAVPLVPSPR